MAEFLRETDRHRAANDAAHRLAAAFTRYHQDRPIPLNDFRLRLVGVGQLPIAITDLGSLVVEALITFLTTPRPDTVAAARQPPHA